MTEDARRRRPFAGRRRAMPVRGRILGWFIGLLTLAGVAGVVIERQILLQRVEGEVDESLHQEVAEVRRLAGGRNPDTGQPFGEDARAIIDTFFLRNVPHEGEEFFTFVGGQPYRSTPTPVELDQDPEVGPRWARLQRTEEGELSTPAGPVRYLAVPLRSGGTTQGVMVIANFYEEETREVNETILVAAGVSGVLLVVASVLAWIVAGRILRPIQDLTRTASAISETDLRQRIEVRGRDEIAELARTFNSMLDRLESAFSAQREFIDDASHELRTPITVVRGHLELLGDDPDERRETVELVTDELDRMTRIVDDLLVLAKSEQPDFVQPDPVDLGTFTAELYTKASSFADRRWELDVVTDVEIRADRHRLTQAMLNLVANAVQHTEPGQEIGLGAAVVDHTARLWVRDDGPGIDPADQERIFRRFARVGDHRRSEGAGLGLAIVSSIAEAHGGRVQVDSRPGHGSTFTIILPASPSGTR